jgi:hypothetical protein
MKGDTLTLYVRSGFDGKKYGACPFSQRIFMLLIIKASKGKTYLCCSSSRHLKVRQIYAAHHQGIQR